MLCDGLGVVVGWALVSVWCGDGLGVVLGWVLAFVWCGDGLGW